jgi:SEFIR domain
MTPKVFISYSWTTHSHQSRIKEWAEQLINDGVEVILDVFDLKEGYDKFVFMEQMVTDSSVSSLTKVIR